MAEPLIGTYNDGSTKKEIPIRVNKDGSISTSLRADGKDVSTTSPVPVKSSSADGDDATFGRTDDAFATTDTGTFTFMAFVKRLLKRLPSLVDMANFTHATSQVSLSGFIVDEVTGALAAESTGVAARADSKRAVIVTLEDATTKGRRLLVNTNGSVNVNVLSGIVGLYGQSATIAVAGTLVVPATATKVILQAFAQNVRFCLDGTTPTATRGFQLTPLMGVKEFPVTVGTNVLVIEEAATATIAYQFIK